MDVTEFRTYCKKLEVQASVSAVDLEQAHMRKAYAARQAGDDALVAELRQAFDALQLVVRAREKIDAKNSQEAARDKKAELAYETLVANAEEKVSENSMSDWDPRNFRSIWVNLLAPPVVIGLAWLISVSPLGFFFQAFFIWIHELGHATVAWMSGYKALPLPMGWTNISPEKQDFVYWGVLFLLGVFFVAGWKERRLWPLIIAPIIAVAQWWMTWKVPEWRTEMWITFGGVGGEFYLSALMVVAFFVDLPEKFRWGSCRYLFLFMGAACFLDSYIFWREVAAGTEDIPWGTMIHGEGDEGGDMNKLHEGWGWPIQKIYQTYNAIGTTCLIAVAAIYTLANFFTIYLKGVRS